MPRRKPETEHSEQTLDANQVVAYNFRVAREWRGWTQDETAAELEPYLGQKLKKASISAIERSVESDRRRVFTAQEILAFSLGFKWPIIWFFMPPKLAHGLPDTLEGYGGPVTDLWALTIGFQDWQIRDLEHRLNTLADNDDTWGSFAERVSDTAKKGLGFSPDASWENFKKFRESTLVDLVVEEREQIKGLFDDLEELVEKYRGAPIAQILAADAPRSAFSNASKTLLGEKIFRLLGEEFPASSPYGVLRLGPDTPWEEIFDLDDPAIREGFVAMATAAESRADAILHNRAAGQHDSSGR